MRDWLYRQLASPWLRAALVLAVTGLLLYLALRNVDLFEIGASLHQASPGPLWIALLSIALNNLAKAARWQVMLSPSGKPPRLSRLFMIILVGQVMNLFLPGRAGDFTRAIAVGQSDTGPVFALGTIALEKVLDLVCYGFLFICLLLVLPMPAWFQKSGYTLTALSGLLIIGVWLLARFPEKFTGSSERMVRWLPQKVSAMVVKFVQSGLSSLKVVNQPAQMLLLAFWSAVVWATAVWTNQLVFQSLHLDLSWTAAVFLLIVLQAGISLPTMLGRIGIFQYICLLVLGLFGVSAAVSMSYGIVLQALITLPTTLLGLVSFYFISLSNGSHELRHAMEQLELKVKQGFEG